MPHESFCAKVPKNYGARIMILANKLEVLDKKHEIQKNANSICVPFIRQPSEDELIILKAQVPDLQILTHVFPERKQRGKSLAEVLESQLPPHLLTSLPRALDIIGEIAIIEIPHELKTHESLIGEAILKTHKNIRTVLAKAGVVSGTYRLREFDIIAGEPRTDTVHKEYGCKYYVDVAKAYFSPRLSSEHKRVASLIQKGETVADLFAGVGPFSVLIAKNNEDAKVYAVDMNPEAIESLKRNIRLNRVENRVFPILGDARQIADDKLLGVADRVIMNLPEKSIEFIETACRTVKPTGGVIHFYGFIRLPDSLENMKLRFSEAIEKAGRKVDRFLFAKTIRATAPYKWQSVLDAKIL